MAVRTWRSIRRTLRHDLRTPINAIKGYGEMLREDAADGGADTLVADLDKLLGEATLLLDRIDGLVTFSGERYSAIGWNGPAASETGAPARMVENLLKAVRPITEKEADLAAITPSRILVVDDNASNRDLLSRRLQRQGHTVLQAEDGTIALALVEKEALDLVLLDLMMPGISGYDVLTSLKNDPRFREIPVIMISALSELDSIVRCIEAGADDYLAKPFDPTLLRARVGSSLEKKHLRDREQAMVEALRTRKGAVGAAAPQHSAEGNRHADERRRDDHRRPAIRRNDSVRRSCSLHQAYVAAFGRGLGSSFEQTVFGVRSVGA